MQHTSLSLGAAAVATLVLAGCATNPVTGKRQVMLVSENQELAMGQQADPAVVAQFGLYPDKKIQRFITEKGKAMAAVSHRAELWHAIHHRIGRSH